VGGNTQPFILLMGGEDVVVFLKYVPVAILSECLCLGDSIIILVKYFFSLSFDMLMLECLNADSLGSPFGGFRGLIINR
jgi:hypothetical protein